MDWMRNWEAILTAAGVPLGDPQIRSRETWCAAPRRAGQGEAGPSRDGIHGGGGGDGYRRAVGGTNKARETTAFLLCLGFFERGGLNRWARCDSSSAGGRYDDSRGQRTRKGQTGERPGWQRVCSENREAGDAGVCARCDSVYHRCR